jgi:hypothetical protein
MRAGRHTEVLAGCEEGLRAAATYDDHWVTAELHRARGTLPCEPRGIRFKIYEPPQLSRASSSDCNFRRKASIYPLPKTLSRDHVKGQG